MNFDDVIGKAVDTVELNKETDRITFKFLDGTERGYGVKGDCCSHSWIEHLEMPDDVRGAVIQSVDDGGEVEPWDGHVCVERQYDDDYKVTEEGCGHDSLAVYNTRFRTNKGDVVFEYRNDSNGYYGGYLID